MPPDIEGARPQVSLNWLRRLERKLPWGVVGTAVGTILGVGGIYASQHERKPALSYELVSQANVLDVHRTLPQLSILYQGQDIQQKDLNLRILQVQVHNTGETDILQSQYDQTTPFGIVVHRARILEARLIRASSPYLTSAIVPKSLNDSTTEFPKPILERDASFTVEFVLLHHRDIAPSVQPIGKIAGVLGIPVLTDALQPRREGFFRRTYLGDVAVQVTRLTSYSFVGLVLLVLILLSRDGWNSFTAKRNESRRRQEILAAIESRVPPSRSRAAIVETYAIGAGTALQALEELQKMPNFRALVAAYSREPGHTFVKDPWGAIRKAAASKESASPHDRFQHALAAMLNKEKLAIVDGNASSLDGELAAVTALALDLVAPESQQGERRPSPPSISINSVTNNATGFPVNVGNVAGQIDIKVNTSGGGLIEVFLSSSCVSNTISPTDVAVASQHAPSGQGGQVILSVNTAQLAAGNVPRFPNGNYCVKARLTNGSATAIATNTTPITLNNTNAAAVKG